MKRPPIAPLSSPSLPSPSQAQPGVVYLVGAGPGDPGLITVRGADLLASADVVLHDQLVPAVLLERVRPSAVVQYVGKRGCDPDARQTSQSAIERDLVAHARAGKSVVRLKGGDPFLFGRGSEEAEALAEAGIPFEVVPGIPSPLGATAYAGISVTHRDLASSVTFVSGTGRNGAPFDFAELARVRGTVCVLMAMHRLETVCEALMRDGARDPATPAAVIQSGSCPRQAVVEGRLDSVAELARDAGLGSPAILVVGRVAELRKTLRWFDSRPLFGKRVLVTRPEGQAAATSEMLRQRGAEPIELPTIQIGPPQDPARVRQAVRELDRYDLVAFTSENGVGWFFQAIDAEGLDARAFGRARVATIGPGTARSLAERGIKADIVPGVFNGDALAEAILADPTLLALRSQRATRVLVPRAQVAREALPEILRRAGVEVDVVPVYQTTSAPPERLYELVRRLEEGSVDVVMFTSSSTVSSLCDLLGARAASLLASVLVASIGPFTTKTAEERGLSASVTATTSTIAGLIVAIEETLASSPSHAVARP